MKTGWYFTEINQNNKIKYEKCWYFTEINQNNRIKYENMLIFYGNKSK